MAWWLKSETNPGMYRNTSTRREKSSASFANKNGFSAPNVRRGIVRRERTRKNLNGSTVKSYNGISAGSFERPGVAIKNISHRSINPVAANVKMLFVRSDGTHVWVSTGYTAFSGLDKVISRIIERYGSNLPTYLDFDILSWGG
jgi:hypothetical protein